MGWNISHGTDSNGEVRRSYTTMHNLGQQLAHVLSARDWRTIAFLFDGNACDVVIVAPRKAGKIAVVLSRAAQHRLMPSDWAKDAQALADSAQRAATARQPWEWS
ncbi:DUF7739 domain-containing protein [Streptomyces sp. NEAU-174]|uniref:DUF7739 domain-containing protein n=1 Tax=Streptomyces sp. NEAU-174 TaxID=3458254 RepID=UPI00404432D0